MAVSLTVKYYTNEIVPNLQSYDLKVEVVSATDMPTKIFVMQHGVPSDAFPNDPIDRFVCIADPVDLEEFPEDVPDLAHEMPYFRVSVITLRFRSPEILEEVKDLIAVDLQQLVDSLKAAESLNLTEEETYA